MERIRLVEVRELHLRLGAHFELLVPHFDMFTEDLRIIRGANGSGKSTFLEALIGYRKIESGKIALFDIDSRDHEFPRVVATRVYFLPQGNRVFERLSISDNLDVFLGKSLTKLERHELIKKYAPKIASNRISAGSLSKGERLRLNLASIERYSNKVASDLRVALMDEPFAGLDQEGVALVSSAISQLRKNGWAIVLSNHVSDLDQALDAEIWTVEQDANGKYQIRQ